MAASLDDLLTTQKNGVVGINGIANTLSKIYTNFRNVPIVAGPAGTSPSAIYTSPSGTVTCLTDIEIVNTGTTSATFYINIVPAGGSASAANAIFYSAPIAPNTTVQWTGNLSVQANGFVSAYASSTAVTFTLTGVLST